MRTHYIIDTIIYKQDKSPSLGSRSYVAMIGLCGGHDWLVLTHDQPRSEVSGRVERITTVETKTDTET